MELDAIKDVDRNVLYLAATVLFLAAAAGAHNVMVEDETVSFGLCDTEISCQGPTVAGYCLGVNVKEVSCIAPENASTAQRAEAECGLDAQGLCNANPEFTGTEWTDHPNATFQGRSCSDWADDDGITLLTCEDTFHDISRWSGG